jgi:hypothetical protein
LYLDELVQQKTPVPTLRSIATLGQSLGYFVDMDAARWEDAAEENREPRPEPGIVLAPVESLRVGQEEAEASIHEIRSQLGLVRNKGHPCSQFFDIASF